MDILVQKVKLLVTKYFKFISFYLLSMYIYIKYYNYIHYNFTILTKDYN